MKTKLMMFFFFFSAASAQAVCRSVFSFSGQGNIAIGAPTAGDYDPDAHTLWESMNVPIQNSFLGPGKSIVTAGRDLNFVCGVRNSNEYTCSIVLNKKASGGEAVELWPSQKKMSYKVVGERASQLAQLFYLKAGAFEFLSGDQKFFLRVRPELFEIRYSEDGL